MNHIQGRTTSQFGFFKDVRKNISDLTITPSIQTFKTQSLGLEELQSCALKLAQLSEQGRWIVLINVPNIDYKKILINAGVRIDKVLLVKTKDEVETLWAMEKGLTNGKSSAVIAWSSPLDSKDNRRLQLVAKSARAQGWLIEQLKIINNQIMTH